MTKTKVAINGLGRIGRAFLKTAWSEEQIEIVAVNDLGDLANLAYLLKYDSAYGQSKLEIETAPGQLIIAGRPIKFFQEKDPSQLPWADLEIDVVVESTGVFETYAKAQAHLKAGAKKVVISAPVKDDPLAGIACSTVLMGVNDDDLSAQVMTSNGSCTTNASAPLIRILDEALGIEKALLNTVHGYTASQRLVDSPDQKDWRRGRAGAVNIVPSTTGAAQTVGKVWPAIEGKFDGLSLRVPVLTGSIVDVTFISKRETSVEEVNAILTQAASDTRWQGIFAVTTEPLVSADIVGTPFASLADLSLTKVVDGNLVKVLAWYDNEIGYAHTLVEHVIKSGRLI
ncbi:MAG: type I glyceraldehyde-3-phosphate dehydrogenase [Candidatus Vogelbacteria bacterium CG22_combo_CG10-13_8_21_14_all_37_9]|uniref:Type I glyceraldehyde-3-phosphate dehydrogenase n=1 Tax=Candidatus Vogelbacteria bacterium CG22_combo_CG10-13_8_21_14_all_37_9 TaxID=1975046 RepID=A0A2H0BL32_9BACT|nr:MAG: type I glyceraldehyde-3-phosphate dehydrogenase [bacterium CG10_37_50]PIP58385.1 MAG: type I glyceraldehyde-3-phosphate dehydrogenase [Candidatus Vogelbacteria bacterium CG22_combo_CG10-13_8_21_14_all_37_9]